MRLLESIDNMPDPGFSTKNIAKEDATLLKRAIFAILTNKDVVMGVAMKVDVMAMDVFTQTSEDDQGSTTKTRYVIDVMQCPDCDLSYSYCDACEKMYRIVVQADGVVSSIYEYRTMDIATAVERCQSRPLPMPVPGSNTGLCRDSASGLLVFDGHPVEVRHMCIENERCTDEEPSMFACNESYLRVPLSDTNGMLAFVSFHRDEAMNRFCCAYFDPKFKVIYRTNQWCTTRNRWCAAVLINEWGQAAFFSEDCADPEPYVVYQQKPTSPIEDLQTELNNGWCPLFDSFEEIQTAIDAATDKVGVVLNKPL